MCKGIIESPHFRHQLRISSFIHSYIDLSCECDDSKRMVQVTIILECWITKWTKFIEIFHLFLTYIKLHMTTVRFSWGMRPSVRLSVGPSGTLSLRRVQGASYAKYSALLWFILYQMKSTHWILRLLALFHELGSEWAQRSAVWRKQMIKRCRQTRKQTSKSPVLYASILYRLYP